MFGGGICGSAIWMREQELDDKKRRETWEFRGGSVLKGIDYLREQRAMEIDVSGETGPW